MNLVRSPALWGSTLLVLFAFRHPLELRLLRHATVPIPDVSLEPVQAKSDDPPFETETGARRFRIFPRFHWDESARVMSERSYHFGESADLIPEDYALAWGPILSPPYAGRIHFSQIARFFLWSTRDGGLDRQTIVTHAANTHIIPGSLRLRRAAACVGAGDDVRLEGWLVDVEGISDPRFHWSTSTRRDDEGPGSCETVYLTRLTINARVYE